MLGDAQLVEALIMKIMKKEKRLSPKELYKLAVGSSRRRTPTYKEILSLIETLVGKESLKQADDGTSVFEYVV